ncbi:MAG: hypothetical protein H5T45_01465 [Thermoplasmatales archaeon]|nr:hypothetical protein [Thermoplasmatales archaeon]
MKPTINILIGDSWGNLTEKNFVVEKLNIRNSVNEEYQTASFQLRDAGTDWKSLNIGKKIVIKINNVEEFRGYIKYIRRFFDGVVGLEVECAGLTYDLYRYEANYTYPAGSYTATIAAALMDGFFPETITKNIDYSSGVAIEQEIVFDGMMLGDCLAYLSKIDGCIFFMDWDTANSRKRINYIKRSEPASPKKFSDNASDNPDRLILNASVEVEDDIRNYVEIIGEENFADYIKNNVVDYDEGVGLGKNYRIIDQIFKATNLYTNLYAIKLRGKKLSQKYGDLKICIYNVAKSVQPSSVTANKTPSGGSLANLYDGNFYTDVSFYLNNGDELTIDYEFSSSQNFVSFIAICDKVENFVYKIYAYVGGSWVEQGNLDADLARELHLASGVTTNKVRLYVKNNSGTTYNFHINEFGCFVQGYDSSRWCVAWRGKALAETNAISLYNNIQWTDWIFFNNPVNLSNNQYYAFSIFLLQYVDDLMYKFSTNNDYPDGKFLILNIPYNEDLCFELGFNYDKIVATASNASSQAAYGVKPYKLNINKLITYSFAKKIADYFANNYNAPNKFVEIEVEGINSLSLVEKVKLYLHSLDNNDLVDVFMSVHSYEHKILPSGRWRTYLYLGRKTEDVIESIIAKLMKGVELV